MATSKVGVFRKWHGQVPTDADGKPLPQSEWARKRPHRWAVRWFGSDGIRYSRSFDGRKEAERFAEEKQAEVREGSADESKPVTLKEYAKMYLSLRGDITSGTLSEHRRTLKFLAENLGAQRLISKITTLDARKFVSWFRQRKFRDKHPAPATVNKLVRECRRIFREALDCSLIRTNPFNGIRQEKVGQIPWQYVSPQQFQALIAACSSLKWRGMITLAYCCGLRLGEVLNLTWNDVDFERQLVRVARKPAEGRTEAWTPKDKDMRLVPLPSTAVNVLTELQLAAPEGQAYVLVNGKGPDAGDRVKRQNITRDFRAIRRRAGIPVCKFHDLRKSFCTNIAQATPLHVVQQLAGHADIRTTQKHYLQVQPELVDAARRAVEEMLKCTA